jgi:hypothetical protein
MESIAQLRKKVQEPVRKYNDVAGLLVGDRLSIHVTRLFVWLKLSPTVATLSMLGFGLAGSLMLLRGGVWSVAGFACVFTYYILDCVDGEVARYHRREKLIWGFHDFMFHLYVKSAFFICLGIYAARFTGRDWVFFFGLSALLGALFQKFLSDLAITLTARQILMRSPEERERYVGQVMAGAPAGGHEPPAAPSAGDESFAWPGLLPSLRAALTNFDLASIVFLTAAILDLFVGPFSIDGVRGNFKIALLVFYGVVYPLDFLDQMLTYIHGRRFLTDARALLEQADDFRLHR